MASDPAGAPAQVAKLSVAAPDVRSAPLAKIRTLTGTVRPAFATKVEPLVATGSPQAVVQVTGGTKWTITWKDVELSLPLSSRAVQVTFVEPTGKVEPEAGEQPTVGCGSTASVALGSRKSTDVPPGSPVVTSTSSLWARAGAAVSSTATRNEPLAVNPPPSVAEQLTVVTPSGNVDPEVGLQVTAGGLASSASVAVALHDTAAPAADVASA